MVFFISGLDIMSNKIRVKVKMKISTVIIPFTGVINSEGKANKTTG